MFFKAKRHQISKNCALSDEIKPKIIFITDILINVRNKSITDLEKKISVTCKKPREVLQ